MRPAGQRYRTKSHHRFRVEFSRGELDHLISQIGESPLETNDLGPEFGFDKAAGIKKAQKLLILART